MRKGSTKFRNAVEIVRRIDGSRDRHIYIVHHSKWAFEVVNAEQSGRDHGKRVALICAILPPPSAYCCSHSFMVTRPVFGEHNIASWLMRPHLIERAALNLCPGYCSL